jgi:GNAT superfamily N-acetyltransferase
VELDPDEFDTPNGAFVVLYRGGAPVGCGGVRWFNPASGTVEVKKTYLAPEARGAGLGRELLWWLEDRAVSLGGRRSILETGIWNTAALRLFAAHGYIPMDSYVAGRDPAINRAFVKYLSPSHRNDRVPRRASRQ